MEDTMHPDGDPKQVMNVVRFQKNLSAVEAVNLLKTQFKQHVLAQRPAMETRLLVASMAHKVAKFGDRIVFGGDQTTSREFLAAVISLHKEVSSKAAPVARELTIVVNNFELKAA